MKTRKLRTSCLVAIASAALISGCSNSSSTEPNSDTGKDVSENITITVFNSKMEIQSQMEQMAEEYSKEKGVNVEIYYSNDTVAAHLGTKYASNDPYTISMVDAKNIYTLGPEHAIDLSGEKWTDETDQEIGSNGKVYGFPVCIEGRGLIYNADAIEAITGEDFDPANVSTLDTFKTLLDKLKAGGMEFPVGIMKEDWSLAGQYLAEVYDKQDNSQTFVEGLHNGSINLNSDEKFNALMDTFDILKENNYAKDSAIAAEREVTEQKLAEGEIAFMYGGNWDWAVINAYDYSENMGIMPVPTNIGDDSNEKIVGGATKFFYIESAESVTEEQQQAAKDFLNWLVYDEDGQNFIVNDCAMVSPFTNNTLAVTDPLSASIKSYMDSGKLNGMWNYQPDDYYSIAGSSFQKYLAGQASRENFASEVQDYWKKAELVKN